MKILTHLNIVSGLYIFLLALIPQIAFSTTNELQTSDISRGSLLFNDEKGVIHDIPLVNTDVKTQVTGPIARTHLTQTFVNPSDDWVEALYLFPLPEDSAVDQLRMVVGNRVIEGQIQEREQAKKTYSEAKKEGKRTALVEQDRPNIFSTSVANIPPKGTIKVEIEFQQSLVWRDGIFSWRFPMAITPRFSRENVTPKYEINEQIALTKGWQVLPNERSQVLDLDYEEDALPPVNLTVTLNPGFKLADVSSRYHRINQHQQQNGGVEVKLAEPNQASDRDFVLSWKPESNAMPNAAIFSEQREDGRYALLMVTPPTLKYWDKPEREITFVIDTSGSMSGQSLRAAKVALENGLNGLESTDSFNVIEFNSDASQLFSSPKDATPYNLAYGKAFVDRLDANGGTEMLPALEMALRKSNARNKLKQVVFITDGAVSAEDDILKFIHSNLGDSRLYTVAIGSAPNSYFMTEAATMGGGTYTYIATPNEAERQMTTLFSKLSQPALINISVQGEGITNVTPNVIPDLYRDEPLVVAMKLDANTNHVVVSGQLGDTLWKQNVTIQALANQSGLATDWARKTITDLQRSGIYADISKDAIRQAITDLALQFHLVSPYTSLVAVDVTPVRNFPDNDIQKSIPTTKPQGLNIKFAQTATGFELSVILGFVLLLISLLFRKLHDKARGFKVLGGWK